MGGDLPAKPGRAKAPTFAIWALKDPESGNLDRIQVIKGYLGGRFDNQEQKIYDVALSDGRKVDPKTGKASAGRQHRRRQERRPTPTTSAIPS